MRVVRRIIVAAALLFVLGSLAGTVNSAPAAADFLSGGNKASGSVDCGEHGSDPSCGIDCSSGSEASTSAVCAERGATDNPVSGSDGVLAHITNIVAFAGGVAAVIVLIVSGIRYMTSGGDTAKVTSAKNTALNTIIGLVIIVLAREIILFVVDKL